MIFNPIMDELFTAEKGGGAWLNDRKRLRVAGRRHLADAVIVTGINSQGRSLDLLQLKQLAQVTPAVAGIRRTGSAALDLAYVACGRADAYFEAGVKPWDIAAGLLLVREAGGRVCDFRGGGDKLLMSGQIVAGNLKITEHLQKAIVSSNYAAAFSV